MVERNIAVDWSDRVPASKGRVELVERKGVGHPDSIADGIAEAVSQELCKMYMAECGGNILHFNVDQNEVSGGQSAPSWGGGDVLEPAYVMILGRAVDEVVYEGCQRVRLPVRRTAVEAARGYLRKNFHDPELSQLHGIDIDLDTIIDCRVGRGSQDLLRNFDKDEAECRSDGTSSTCRPANDTSFGVGSAPRTETEELVLGIEHFINGEMRSRRGMAAAGKDVKVMAARDGNDISLTIACAMISSRVANAAEYRSLMEEMKALIRDRCCEHTEHNVDITLNHADHLESEDASDYYLTVTGLSMENGDDGSVGRGNRVNGLITPFRPMSMEAASGKNPVTHVGKLYNVLANEIANAIADEAGEELSEVRVRLMSQIGSPIDQPALASIDLIVPDEMLYRRWERRAREITDAQLADIGGLTRRMVSGEVPTF